MWQWVRKNEDNRTKIMLFIDRPISRIFTARRPKNRTAGAQRTGLLQIFCSQQQQQSREINNIAHKLCLTHNLMGG